MVKVKTRLAKSEDVPDDFYPDYVFDYLLNDKSLALIEMKFDNGFVYYFASSQYINYRSSVDVLKYFIEEYHLANLMYCSMMSNAAMNPIELQEYLHRDENTMIDYQKCEKLWNFYQKYYNEIKYVIEELK
jgi:hypothetical protein